MRSSLQEFSLPLEGSREWVKAVESLSNRLHYRSLVAGMFGTGWHEFCGFADGFFVTLGDVEFDSPLTVFTSFPDTLRIFVTSHGDGEYVSTRGKQLSLEAPNTAIFLEPADAPDTDMTFAGCTRYICVYIHRKALRTLFGEDVGELPAVVQAFLNGELQQAIARAVPLSAILLRCLDDVQACTLEGARRRLFLQSKAVEIICQALDALELSDGFGSAEATRLTARGVLKAQRLLAEKFAAPPSLEGLALEVGVSRSRLCAGFRQILGRSVADYTLDLRMQQALALLNERDAPISQIAHAVGYNHASSFSAAVQRHFGATPSDLRRRGATPTGCARAG